MYMYTRTYRRAYEGAVGGQLDRAASRILIVNNDKKKTNTLTV